MASRIETIQGNLNPILSEFAAGYATPNSFIFPKVAPVIQSMTESGTFYSLGKEGFYVYDTARALRANAKKIDFAISSDTYVTKEHALETSLDYVELENAEKYGAAQILKLKQRAVNLVQHALSVELEKAVADVIFSQTHYASGNYTTLTGTDQWSHTSSDPLASIATGRAAARADMGVEPNTLVLGYNSYLKLCVHANVKALFSTLKDRPTMFSDVDLAAVLKFKYVYVGSKVYSTDAGVMTDIWTDNAALIYTPEPGEMVEGTCPHTIIVEEMGYPQVKEYAGKKTVDVEVTRKYVVKNINTSFGYLIQDTCA